MKQAVIMLAIGVAVGAAGFWLFTDTYSHFFSGVAERRLIKEWRQIKPNMTVTEVQSILGEPSAKYKTGDDFPDFYQPLIPINYDKKHGALSYTLPGIPIYVLVIFFDKDERVTFVGCCTS